MNAHVDWWILCERVIEDAATHNLTLVATLDGLVALSLPAQHPTFACAARLRRAAPLPDRDLPCAFQILRRDPGEEPTPIASFLGQWPAAAMTTHVFANFPGLRLRAPGAVGFQLQWRLDGAEDWSNGPESFIDVQVAPIPSDAP